MEPTQNWRDLLTLTLDQLLQQLIVFAPKLLGVVVLLLIGWLVAVLLAKAARSGIFWLNKLLGKMLPTVFSRSDAGSSLSYINIVSKCVFWLVLIFFIAAAANSLGLDIVSQWMSQLLLYLPRLAAGLVIIVGGYLGGSMMRVMAMSAAQSAGFGQAELLGRSIQFAVFFTAVVIGIEQLGINIQFFTQFFIVMTAVIAFGFSLAFGLGAKDLVSNIIGVQQVQKVYRVGDKIRICDVSGTLIEISATTVVLESETGRIAIPAQCFVREIGFISTVTEKKTSE